MIHKAIWFHWRENCLHGFGQWNLRQERLFRVTGMQFYTSFYGDSLLSLKTFIVMLCYPHHLTTLVQSFLSERTFQVRVEQSLLEVRGIRAGVSQGSTLSPHLFNIYVSDNPKDRFTTLQLYADDTAISTATATILTASCPDFNVI